MTSNNSRPRYPSHLWTHTGLSRAWRGGNSLGLVSFLTGSGYLAQAGLVLPAPLPGLAQCLDYRGMPPSLT